MPGIYAIVNNVSGKVYVGSTTRSLKRRWVEHRFHLRGNHHFNRHLQFSWNKYGEKTFSFIILAKIKNNVDQIMRLEQEWLDFFRSCGKVYNFGKIAKAPMLGMKTSDETKRKMSLAQRGRVFSKEHKRKLSQAKTGKKRPPYSEEWRRNIGGAQKGKRLSEKVKRKIAESVERSWTLTEKRTNARARPYPAFYNTRTGEYIPAGVNLAALCREKGLSYGTMKKVKAGNNHGGWVVEGEANAFRHST